MAASEGERVLGTTANGSEHEFVSARVRIHTGFMANVCVYYCRTCKHSNKHTPIIKLCAGGEGDSEEHVL
jgi:hypothetical protein